jgi:predicted CxxxxCH...CXXCH cytochrome family protein
MGVGASSVNCATCHPGSGSYTSRHRDGKIKVSSRLNNSQSITQYPHNSAFNDVTSAWTQTANPNPGTCNNVNCHFEASTPVWGTDPAATRCDTCHGAPPGDGSHPKHFLAISSAAGRTPANVCAKCHPDHAIEGYTFGHATSAGKRPLGVQFTAFPNSGGTYSGNVSYPDYLPSHTPARNGTCGSLYCHSNGAPFDKPNVNATPTWGGSVNCASCHDGAGPATGLSGRHGKHTGGDYAFVCERCHSATASGSATIKDRSMHVNHAKDVSFQDGGAYGGGMNCNATWCHTGSSGQAPLTPVAWSDTTTTMECFSCHRGRTSDNTQENCNKIGGVWKDVASPDGSGQLIGVCTPYLSMSSNGHRRLVGPNWIRRYACSNCHSATVTAFRNSTTGKLYDGGLVTANHVNGTKDIKVPDFWAIPGKPLPSYSLYSTATTRAKTCYNVYCHSDGTKDAKSEAKPYAWTDGKTKCNDCHGHANGQCKSCHYDHVDSEGKAWTVIENWPDGQQWKASIPMFANEGPGTPRANSHPKHTQTDFTCNRCHADTVKNGTCSDCHDDLARLGGMTEVAHINPDRHVNGIKDVKLLAPTATYNNDKTCSSTGIGCHAGMTDPQWGGSSSGVSSACMDCHGNSNTPDTDNFVYNGGAGQAKINLQEWYSTGHGRPSSKGPYKSGNPAANFTANACWYCHDSNVMHNMSSTNPFRLRQHQQFKNRFEKECAYCHMEGLDVECLKCHNNTESLAPQLATIFYCLTAKWPDGTSVSRPNHNGLTTCFGNVEADNCHFVDRANTPKKDLKIHNEGSGFWTKEQNEDVKNQYVQMGVCLQCHDDDSGGRCGQCHAEGGKYALGFSVANVPIKPGKARATSAHFGIKHYKAFTNSSGWSKDARGKIKGTWKGGKFCWDCHDPHGDSNIFMIHNKVATSTDGKFGIPKTRADVVFSKKETGADYITKNTQLVLVDGQLRYVGICNVCHSSNSKHYRNDGSDSHNQSRPCTSCHEHRFSDSHAGKDPCNSCHKNKPVPRHSAFGLPRDCTKCHAGPILGRMDVMTQFGANSHHVQGVPVSNRHCYACHWESTNAGLIDLKHHTGFNYKTYSSASNDVVDLVLYSAGKRPTFYSSTSATTFLAKNIGTAKERDEAGKVTNHCLSCHSDQNNEAMPFNDCKTPRHYAWDGLSIAARYSQSGTTPWGKYGTNGKSGVIKAFSAHGNAKANQGGWDDTAGLDGTIPNTRDGNRNVQCYDCHSSHGSKVVGTTSSYVTFNGTRNGANLKETQDGKGGYSVTYKASQNTIASSVNPYAAGAGQCFDCHMNLTKAPDGAIGPPWGFGTFSASRPIKGYRDGYKFGSRTDQAGFGANTFKLNASPMKANKTTIAGGHLKASSSIAQSPNEPIDGLCTPCHDPHGVSPTLGGKQAYAVPLLKGTWMTSPYKEDQPPPLPIARANGLGPKPTATGGSWGSYGYEKGKPNNSPLPGEPVTKIYLDRNTFGAGKTISEDDRAFAGLCLRCHNKEKLTDGTPSQNNYQNQNFRTIDRIHETVKGWGKNKEHAFTCSKCHQPHNSALPRLMQTNCLDYQHRGNRENGGQPWMADRQFGSAHSYSDEHRGYPEGDLMGRYAEASSACHITTPGNSGTWPDNQLWNNKTRWNAY